MGAQPRIIIDWGTTNFRAYRFDADGVLADEHHAPCGILAIEKGGFEAALQREIGSWITPGCTVLLSGMITSRNGWIETPYVRTPARLANLAGQAQRRTILNGVQALFLPGVAQDRPSPDVMRGEEIQVFGSTGRDENAVVILPGTHSKWVRVERGAITEFRTFLTGELFGVLKNHSILGRLIPQNAAPFKESAFRAGARQTRDAASAGLLNDIFTARSGVLLGAFDATDIADRLSGMILGHEISSGLKLGWGGPIRLVGDGALLRRYEIALEEYGQTCSRGPDLATVEGFQRLSHEKI